MFLKGTGNSIGFRKQLFQHRSSVKTLGSFRNIGLVRKKRELSVFLIIGNRKGGLFFFSKVRLVIFGCIGFAYGVIIERVIFFISAIVAVSLTFAISQLTHVCIVSHAAACACVYIIVSCDSCV